ncbi:hypothetical protein ACLOJK_023528 [Asimina triloba]
MDHGKSRSNGQQRFYDLQHSNSNISSITVQQQCSFVQGQQKQITFSAGDENDSNFQHLHRTSMATIHHLLQRPTNPIYFAMKHKAVGSIKAIVSREGRTQNEAPIKQSKEFSPIREEGERPMGQTGYGPGGLSLGGSDGPAGSSGPSSPVGPGGPIIKV